MDLSPQCRELKLFDLPKPLERAGSVAIAVPLSNRAELTGEERISLKHLEHYLGGYDIFFVAPKGLSFEPNGRPVKRFPRRYFGSAKAHSRLLLSEGFYRAFSEYEYLLIYHLDALVFSDQLSTWCKLGFDYLAAPWVTRGANSEPNGISRCGNGGFSLRKVSSFLRVTNPGEQRVSAEEAWRMLMGRRPRYQRLLLYPLKPLLYCKRLNRSWWVRTLYSRNEDRFWSDQAKLFVPEFRVAPAADGLRFAFDEEPRFCFERNRYRLPFGCHGWNKHCRRVWEPFLLP